MGLFGKQIYSNRELKAVLENIPGGIVVLQIGETSRIIFANEGFQKFIGYSVDAINNSTYGLRDFLFPADEEKLIKEISIAIKQKTKFNINFRLKKADRGYSWVHCEGNQIDYDGIKQPVIMAVIVDINKEKAGEADVKEAYEQLEYRANYDILTGIMNRSAFYRAAGKLLEDNDASFNILRINIERFKAYNDVYGFEAGNELLQRIARVLERAFVTDCAVGRLDADHFAVCYPRNRFDLTAFYKEMTQKCNSLNPNIPVVLSFGVYNVTDRSLAVNIMCDRANMAQKNIDPSMPVRIVYYDDDIRKKLFLEQELLGAMDSALANKELEVFFQPIVSVSQKSVVAAEALIRWRHPTKGLLSPAVFLPIIEKNGYMARVDAYVWEEACRYLSERKRNGDKLIPLSVNVSRSSLYNSRLAEIFCGMTAKYDIPNAFIKVEITENAYNDNPKQLMSTIANLQSNGFEVLMDDFGSGFSSLNMLKELPVDVLKIDMKFVESLDKSLRSGKILIAVVNMAKSLNLRIVCEGVENEPQVNFLADIGCDLIQGYYFSKPLEEKEFNKFLVENTLFDSLDAFQSSDEERSGLVKLALSGNETVNAFFENIRENMAVCSFYNGNLDILRVNKGYYNLMGCTPEELNKEGGTLSYVIGDDKVRLSDACKSVADNPDINQSLHIKQKIKDQVRTLEVDIHYLGKEGNKAYLCLYYCDVTGIKVPCEYTGSIIRNTDKELNKDELLLLSRAVVQQADLGVLNWNYTEKSFISTDNLKKYVICSKPPQEVLDNLVSGFGVYNEDIKIAREYAEKRKQRKAHIETELRLLTVDAGYSWVKLISNNVYGEQGESIRTICTVQNINARKTAELKLQNTTEVLQNIIYNLPVGICIFELTRTSKITVKYVTEKTSRMFGYGKGDFNNEVMSRVFVNALPKIITKAGEDLTDKASVTIEMSFVTSKKIGESITVQMFCLMKKIDDETLICYSTVTDISDKVLKERQTKKQEEWFRILMEDSQTVIFDYDCEKDIMEYSIKESDNSRSTRTVYDYLSKYAATTPVISDDTRDIYIKGLQEASAKAQSGSLEYKGNYSGKGFRWCQAKYKSLCYDDGKVFRILGRVIDVQEEKDYAMDLKEKAEIDTLSGLYNRGATEEYVNDALKANRSQNKYAMVILDIDRFKSFNDSYGHPFGDMVIKDVCGALKAHSEDGDIVGRSGGDEFVWLMNIQDGNTDANVVLKRRMDSFYDEVKILGAGLGVDLTLTLSAGVAKVDYDDDNFNGVFAKADLALYQAKRSGKNQYCILN